MHAVRHHEHSLLAKRTHSKYSVTYLSIFFCYLLFFSGGVDPYLPNYQTKIVQRLWPQSGETKVYHPLPLRIRPSNLFGDYLITLPCCVGKALQRKGRLPSGKLIKPRQPVSNNLLKASLPNLAPGRIWQRNLRMKNPKRLRSSEGRNVVARIPTLRC